MTTRSEFSSALNEMQHILVHMAGIVEQNLAQAVQALAGQDAEEANRIIHTDVQVNAAEKQILDLGIRLIATQQPVAKDLRRIISAIKISSDLERMADLSVDIAKSVVRMNDQPLQDSLSHIQKMANLTVNMIQASIKAYVNEDVPSALKMAENDDEVDELYSSMLKQLFAFMAEHPDKINQVMLLCFVGRFIERIGDYATNIGEQVVYLVEGELPDLNT